MQQEFKETQRFLQWWLWLIISGIMVMMFFGLWDAWERKEKEEVIYLVCMIILFPLLFLGLMRLKTRITDTGIYVRFIPFHFSERYYAFTDLSECYVRTYDALFEYGGWGIKYGFSGQGKVFNVSGNQGLQLVFKSGERLLIGTDQPEAIQAILPPSFIK